MFGIKYFCDLKSMLHRWYGVFIGLQTIKESSKKLRQVATGMLKETIFVAIFPAFPSSSFSMLSITWSSPHLPPMLPNTAMSQSFSRTAAPLGFALACLGYFFCPVQVPREMEEKLRAETDSCRSAILDSSYISPFHVLNLFYLQSCLHSC